MARRGSYTWAVANYGKPCNQKRMARIEVQPGVFIWADSRTVAAWKALGAVMTAYNYQLRQADTGAYNCRPVTGGKNPSRHAHGIAGDFNWSTNPYVKTPTLRKIRWGIETDMPAAMVREIEAITAGGVQAFSWGGRWRRVKDAMHFELLVTPAEIAAGVRSPRPSTPTPEEDEMSLSKGDRGASVKLYQHALNRFRPSFNLTVDGIFGDDTRQAVLDYQAAADLDQTGIIDGVTAANLSRYVPVASAGDVGSVVNPAAHAHAITALTVSGMTEEA